MRVSAAAESAVRVARRSDNGRVLAETLAYASTIRFQNDDIEGALQAATEADGRLWDVRPRPTVMWAASHLVWVFRWLRRPDDAERVVEQAMGLRSRVRADRADIPRRYRRAWASLTFNRARQSEAFGLLDEAEALFCEAIDTYDRAIQWWRPIAMTNILLFRAEARAGLAGVLSTLDRHGDAIETLVPNGTSDLLRILARVQPHLALRTYAGAQLTLAEAYAGTGEHQTARGHARTAVAAARLMLTKAGATPDDYDRRLLAAALTNLAVRLTENGGTSAEAADLLEEALGIRRGQIGDGTDATRWRDLRNTLQRRLAQLERTEDPDENLMLEMTAELADAANGTADSSGHPADVAKAAVVQSVLAKRLVRAGAERTRIVAVTDRAIEHLRSVRGTITERMDAMDSEDAATGREALEQTEDRLVSMLRIRGVMADRVDATACDVMAEAFALTRRRLDASSPDSRAAVADAAHLAAEMYHDAGRPIDAREPALEALRHFNTLVGEYATDDHPKRTEWLTSLVDISRLVEHLTKDDDEDATREAALDGAIRARSALMTSDPDGHATPLASAYYNRARLLFARKHIPTTVVEDFRIAERLTREHPPEVWTVAHLWLVAHCVVAPARLSTASGMPDHPGIPDFVEIAMSYLPRYRRLAALLTDQDTDDATREEVEYITEWMLTRAERAIPGIRDRYTHTIT